MGAEPCARAAGQPEELHEHGILFAFLPQFVPPEADRAVPRMLALSTVFMAMTFAVFALYGVCAASVRTRLLSRPRVVDRVRRAFAVSFLALSAKLAVTDR